MRRRIQIAAAALLSASLWLPATACGRYGPPERAPEYRDEGGRVTEATSAMGRGSDRADESGEDE